MATPSRRVYWRCYTCSTVGCGATVTQSDDCFVCGRHVHVDQPVTGEAVIARVRIKEAAKTDVFKSANDIADDVLHDILTANNNVHAEAFPNPDALRRAANRACQANRPKDPTTLDFELDHNFYLAIFYVFVKKIVI